MHVARWTASYFGSMVVQEFRSLLHLKETYHTIKGLLSLNKVVLKSRIDKENYGFPKTVAK